MWIGTVADTKYALCKQILAITMTGMASGDMFYSLWGPTHARDHYMVKAGTKQGREKQPWKEPWREGNVSQGMLCGEGSLLEGIKWLRHSPKGLVSSPVNKGGRLGSWNYF